LSVFYLKTMNLILRNLVPHPFKDTILPNSSDIWMRDLFLRKGEHILIQAPSGTGKTTLMHMLYGLRKDFAGELLWGDYAFQDIQPAQLASLRASYISIVFQDIRLFPELTAWENIEIKRFLTNTMPTERVEDMLARLSIFHKKDSIVSKLSQGEKQRVAIIKALVQPFDWLLMDEPFSHLDSQNKEKAAALVSEIVSHYKAGILLADLDKNQYFRYHKILYL
jgi:ABC-type lipoprotein export system ATPase subunit